jgi:hypothetical protein
MTRRALGVALFAALTGVAGAAPVPSTLVQAPGRIAGVAQDGPRVLWGYLIPSSASCLDAVRVRNLANGTEASLTHSNSGGCQISTPYGSGNEWFALAGRSALWTVHEYGHFTYVNVVVGLSGGSDRFLGQVVHDNADGTGDHFTGAAGDGPTLVYSWAHLVPNVDCVDHPECQLIVRGGGIRRIVGNTAVNVPHAPPATAVAASGRTIAIAVAPIGARWRNLKPPQRIELRRVPSGALLGSLAVQGRARALALSRRLVAVLLAQGTSQRVDLYSTATRSLVRSVRVPPRTASALSLSGRTVVFRSGLTIYALDTSSGRVTAVAHAGRQPLGLTIEGRRVAWAENYPVGHRESRGRVKTLTLP